MPTSSSERQEAEKPAQFQPAVVRSRALGLALCKQITAQGEGSLPNSEMHVGCQATCSTSQPADNTATNQTVLMQIHVDDFADRCIFVAAWRNDCSLAACNMSRPCWKWSQMHAEAELSTKRSVLQVPFQ